MTHRCENALTDPNFIEFFSALTDGADIDRIVMERLLSLQADCWSWDPLDCQA
jgi:hypothetical protein